ncbi:hypothetical protein [Photobacterium sanguinicancri]|uniref:hypothetical protein n=1 Tax=Photobacterium sanguinicancri TaxID=875932 RepID=UPI00247FDAB9|nr:hypothetical protein [Photobacterium sanguinicancri]
MNTLALMIIGLSSGMIASYSETVAGRGGIQREHSLFAVITFLSMISTFSLIIWGFMNLNWWIPIVAFLGISILQAFLMGRTRFIFFYAIAPILGLITIALASYIWFL